MGYLLDTGCMHNYENLNRKKLPIRIVIITQTLVNTIVMTVVLVLASFRLLPKITGILVLQFIIQHWLDLCLWCQKGHLPVCFS
jgi:hypothetical protein